MDGCMIDLRGLASYEAHVTLKTETACQPNETHSTKMFVAVTPYAFG